MNKKTKKKVSFSTHKAAKSNEDKVPVATKTILEGSLKTLQKVCKISELPSGFNLTNITDNSKTSAPRLKPHSSGVPKKSVVRNCDARNTSVHIIKPHECEAPDPTLEKDNSQALPSERERNTCAVPTQHTILKISKEIHRVSDLNLETAYKSVKALSMSDEDNNEQKLSRLALNIGPNEHIFTDLVSVEVSESQIRPKITDIRKHRVRSKRDSEPHLEDFCTPDSMHQENCWPNFPPIKIPFTPVQLYDGRTVATTVAKWQHDTEKLLQHDTE